MRKILVILLAGALLLSGCEQNENDAYVGMERDIIQDIVASGEMDYVHEFRGQSENWAAMYIVYKPKGEENHTSRPFLKYIGKDPRPRSEAGMEVGHSLALLKPTTCTSLDLQVETVQYLVQVLP